MKVTGLMLHHVNKLVIAGIRALAKDKDRAFARWSKLLRQLFRKLPGRTFFGATFECDLRDHIMSRIFFFGVWEPSVSRTIMNVLQPGDLFVDVGANVGYDSLLASKRVGEQGNVVAIEAASTIFSQLISNVAYNRVKNVRTVNAAVGRERGNLTLYGGDDWNQGRTSPLPREGLRPIQSMPMLPLDEILTVDERSRARLIKIDIEGGEVGVLERLVETLDLYNENLHILVEVSAEPTGAAAELFKLLTSNRFKAVAIANDYSVGSYLKSTAPVPPRPIAKLPPHQTDVLFIPASA
jgi:FkbM family methyltransferase